MALVFEGKGKQRLKHDDLARTWYADFLAFVREEGVFATLLTPTSEGPVDTRWDTWRNCELNEILGFYGLCYWYTWQVSILGLGPLWMSSNAAMRQRTAQLLRDALHRVGGSFRDRDAGPRGAGNDTMSTSAWAAMASPTTGPTPVTRLNTPAGRPASSMTSARMKALIGATSLGFSTTVLPAANAGATLSAIWCSG